MRRNDTALLLVLLLAALMRAVKWGLGAVVDLFLDAGANAAIKDYEGKSALEYAQNDQGIRKRLDAAVPIRKE